MPKTTVPKSETYPLHQRLLLSITETALYSGIGMQKVKELTEKEDCDFVLQNGNKTMIKREEFEAYIRQMKRI